jgi:hypothetical protein
VVILSGEGLGELITANRIIAGTDVGSCALFAQKAATMARIVVGATSTSPEEIRRVFFASIVGTIIEWYDFLLYGIAAALIFNKQPTSSEMKEAAKFWPPLFHRGWRM